MSKASNLRGKRKQPPFPTKYYCKDTNKQQDNVPNRRKNRIAMEKKRSQSF